MTQEKYQAILSHCLAAYKGLNTAIEEFSKAINGYLAEEIATQLNDDFADEIFKTDCYKMICDIVGQLVTSYHCDQTHTSTD